jgi:FKBP-type peptidyl-prolyl cis-trans isomerase FklB
MQKISLLLLSMSVSATLAAQQTAKPVAKTAAKPTTKVASTPGTTVTMKNSLDSMSYAIGCSIAQFYKQQGISGFNSSLVSRGLADATNQKSLLNEEQINMSITNYLQKIKAEKAAGNKKIGQEFLAENSKKPGVVTLPSGLQYIIVKEGTGEKPTLTDKVKCHYHGTLIDGKVFDSSVDRGQPIDFPVNGVIKGWTEALQLMPVGSKWKLFIPSDLAYGDNQAGPTILPGSTLIFDVELLEIVK